MPAWLDLPHPCNADYKKYMNNYQPLRIMAIVSITSILAACSTIPDPGEPVAYPVTVNGEPVILKQITESTWTAKSPAHLKTLTNTAASVTALRKAVETTSGCKVTDSDFSRQGQQFDAQVDCGSNLSN